ncbi:MAG TPA: ornithine cyclodeaminase family protein [Trueperaceae bacterium]|nr:ornithine cyclodeaminase family protein [Trueperaceae bacterium]
MTSTIAQALNTDHVTNLVPISGEQVASLLDMATCIGLMRSALMALGTSRARQMVRPVLPLNGRTVLGMMPAYDEAAGVAGVKVLTVFPDNYRRGLPSHQGVIVLFDASTGALRAIVDAEAITAIRTAAASAAATAELANPDAAHLAILGTGVQARQHLAALSLVRAFRSVTVWDRQPARAEAFAEQALTETGLRVIPCTTVSTATADADVICTVTAATEPILVASDVKPGAHINAVGACTPDARELSADLVAAGRLFVDWRPAALKEAGDILLAIKDGAVTESHIVGEVGSVMTGDVAGRTDPNEITIYESLGQAVQDLIAANHVANALRPDSPRQVTP